MSASGVPTKDYDFEDWEFGEDLGEIEVAARRVLRRSVKSLLEDTYISFPAITFPNDSGKVGRHPAPPPLTIEVSFGDQLSFSVRANLRDVLEEDIKDCAADGSSAEGLRRIGEALVDLGNDCINTAKLR